MFPPKSQIQVNQQKPIKIKETNQRSYLETRFAQTPRALPSGKVTKKQSPNRGGSPAIGFDAPSQLFRPSAHSPAANTCCFRQAQLFTWRGIPRGFRGANGASHISGGPWILGQHRSCCFIPLQALRNWRSSDAGCQPLQLVLSKSCFFSA